MPASASIRARLVEKCFDPSKEVVVYFAATVQRLVRQFRQMALAVLVEEKTFETNHSRLSTNDGKCLLIPQAAEAQRGSS